MGALRMDVKLFIKYTLNNCFEKNWLEGTHLEVTLKRFLRSSLDAVMSMHKYIVSSNFNN